MITYLVAEVPELAPDNVDDLEDFDVQVEDEEVAAHVHGAVHGEARHTDTSASVAHQGHREGTGRMADTSNQRLP